MSDQPNQLISQYIDNLLSDEDLVREDNTQKEPQIETAQNTAVNTGLHSPYNQQRSRLEVLLQQAQDNAIKEAVKASDHQDEQPQDEPQVKDWEWLENGRPVWAQSRFDILLLNVAGLSLAVPLVALGQIQLLDDITPIFGQSDWFMGLQTTSQGKVRVVNTAKFVMPERYQDDFIDQYKYVVSINNLPWGMAVSDIGQPISVEVDDVRWRSARTQRLWLAGTIKQHMCALLDVPTMGRLLQEKDKGAH